MISPEELFRRFEYHAPDATRAQEHEDIRTAAKGLAKQLTAVLPPGREASLAITHLEEVVFWANAALARQ